MPPKIARLAGLGAFGACAAFVALYAFVAVHQPTNTPTGGMHAGAIRHRVTISIGLVVLALIAVHIVIEVVIGKQLMRLAAGTGAGVLTGASDRSEID